MEHELLVLALGYHITSEDARLDATIASDSVKKLAAHLPLGEQNRVERTANLARKYSRVLAWARRARRSSESACCRVLASRIEQLLTTQIDKASKIRFVGVNDIYVVLWQLETIVDHFEEYLLASPQKLDLFVTQTLQDALTSDSNISASIPTSFFSVDMLTFAKYDLFKHYLMLQRNLLISWICYCRLPSYSLDFWIERNNESEKTGNTQPTSISSWDIWNEYNIILDRLPSLLITESLASNILFIGVAVKVLHIAKKMTKESEIWLLHKTSSIFLQSLRQSSPNPSQNSTKTIISQSPPHTEADPRVTEAAVTDTSSTPALIIPTSHSFNTFFGHWNVLEATVKISEMASWAANALYSLIMKENALVSHLQVLRDFFFLQDGFFYRTLFFLASGLLETSPGVNAEHDINIFFQESAVAKQFLGEDTKSALFQNLSLTFLPSYNCEQKPAVVRLWSDLSLDYATSWPLNLILTPPTLRQYNEIFQFLFQVKRVQIGLQNNWQASPWVTLRHLNGIMGFRLAHRMQMIRHQMSFFIDTLTQYLHVDVFASEIQAFDAKLARCVDFEDLLVTHQSFLSQLSLQCFLNVAAFKRAFSNIFGVIESYLSALRVLIDCTTDTSPSSGSISDPSVLKSIENINSELESIMKEWSKHTNLLFTLLSGVKGQAPHLHQLLLLLDYNLFWSNGKSLLELEIELAPKFHPNLRMRHVSSIFAQIPALPTEHPKRAQKPRSSSQTSSLEYSFNPPNLSTTSRARATSSGAPKVAELPPKLPSKSSGPRPELLSRLMKKSRR